MAGENLLAENSAIVAFDSPKNAAANAVEWINMANFQHLTVIMAAEGVAAQTILFVFQQAQSNTGTGVKSLSYTERYSKSAADITTVASFTKIEGTATGFTTTAEEEILEVVEIDSADLDIVNGFTHVGVTFSDPGAADHAVAVIGILTNPRYRQNIIGSAID